MSRRSREAARTRAVTVERFSRVVRWVHGVTGGLVVVCLLTAAVLYNGSLAVLVGNRDVVETVHVWCGWALPVPLLVGLLARSYRRDLTRLDRFTPDDWRWLRSRTRRNGALRVGKFNAGQKLNASLSAGAIGALLLSGTVMELPRLTPLGARVGATFVHDWTALLFGLLVLGHVRMATRDPDAMQGIRTGRVPLVWARREHAAWADEVAPGADREGAAAGAGRGGAGPGGAGPGGAGAGRGRAGVSPGRAAGPPPARPSP